MSTSLGRVNQGSPQTLMEDNMYYNITQGAERSAPTVIVRTNADLRNKRDEREPIAHCLDGDLVSEVNHFGEVELD